jgi:hypothetical protein
MTQRTIPEGRNRYGYGYGERGRKKNMEERLKWAIGLAKLGREKAHTTWQTEIYGKN